MHVRLLLLLQFPLAAAFAVAHSELTGVAAAHGPSPLVVVSFVLLSCLKPWKRTTVRGHDFHAVTLLMLLPLLLPCCCLR